MKCLFSCILICTIAVSCNNSPATKTSTDLPGKDTVQKQSFFPVTAYIKGQLFDIKSIGITPIQYVTIKDHTDSAWLKMDEFEKAVQPFLTPVIDSTNLVQFFTEKNFLDQTIAAYTFTYEPKGVLPDSIALRHWDVYIDQESGKLKRVYIVKETNDARTLQLTWQDGKYCKIVTISNDASGNSFVEKEETITWDF